jgi:hypothetical protein
MRILHSTGSAGKLFASVRYLQDTKDIALARRTRRNGMNIITKSVLRAALFGGAIALSAPAFAAGGGAAGGSAGASASMGAPGGVTAGAGMSGSASSNAGTTTGTNSGSNTGSTTGSMTGGISSPSATASTGVNGGTVTAQNNGTAGQAESAQQNAAKALNNAAPPNGDVNTMPKAHGQSPNASAGGAANAGVH